MNIFVEEIGTTPGSTASQMFVDNKPFCFVVEDGYRDVKIAGETRIPPGRYQVRKHHTGRFFDKYKREFGHDFAIHITNVPGFEWILIHIGNTPVDTRGCLLVNGGIGLDREGNYSGILSTVTYKSLYEKVAAAFSKGEEVWIEVYRREVVNEAVDG